MKVDHGTDYRANVAEHVHEPSFRKKLPEATNVKRIFRRSINPAFFGPTGSATAFQPTPIKVSLDTRGFAAFFQMVTVAQDQLVDSPAESGKKFIARDIH